MYELFASPEPDEILQLSVAFRADTRPRKADLGIGVYKDASGHSPIMRAIKKAEQMLHGSEDSKAYLGLPGDEGFNASMHELLFGQAATAQQASVIQTPGGAGAIRLLFELVRRVNPSATVWISDPTWINHHPMAEAVGLQRRTYRYLDRQHQSLAFAEMMEDLAEVRKGDIVLLHGCCHNPSGVNLTPDHWHRIAEFIHATGAIPLVDIAYQGLGEGLEQDAQGLRHLAATVPELMVAASCSKNFGLYRDRVGCAVMFSRTPSHVQAARANFLALARVNYSFPPNHGAAAIRILWNDAELKRNWMAELEAMRIRLIANREALASTLATTLGSERFDFIRGQRGMFSLLGLPKETIAGLRQSHAVFLPSDGRMNVAGLTPEVIGTLVTALKSAL